MKDPVLKRPVTPEPTSRKRLCDDLCNKTKSKILKPTLDFIQEEAAKHAISKEDCLKDIIF